MMINTRYGINMAQAIIVPWKREFSMNSANISMQIVQKLMVYRHDWNLWTLKLKNEAFVWN
jgi:hypothetical protein